MNQDMQQYSTVKCCDEPGSLLDNNDNGADLLRLSSPFTMHQAAQQRLASCKAEPASVCSSHPRYLEPPMRSKDEAYVRGAPASAPRPVTRLKTPGGRPTSSMMAASSRHVTDVISDGFSTTVQPCKAILYEQVVTTLQDRQAYTECCAVLGDTVKAPCMHSAVDSPQPGRVQPSTA